jgi:hypothetical protein
MKKFASLAILALSITNFAFAQSGTPSSKATAAYNSAVGCSLTATSGTWTCADIFSGAAKLVTADNYVEVMGSTVKVSNSQSLCFHIAGNRAVYEHLSLDQSLENVGRNEYVHGNCYPVGCICVLYYSMRRTAIQLCMVIPQLRATVRFSDARAVVLIPG